MKRIILGLVAGLGLVGCVTPSYNSIPRTKSVSYPELNKITTVNVGDQMVAQGTIFKQDALTIESVEKIRGYTINPGTYNKSGDNENGTFFSAISTSSMPTTNNVLYDPAKLLLISKNNELCVLSVSNSKYCKDKADFKIKEVASENKNSFQQTLIYNGKIGNKINIGYREFSGDFARPAFTNNVEYDLSESKQIGYKGALIDVINASNQSITYKVLKNFNKVD
ncbi:hypothetical protein [Acinetobacter soli]|uniref:hypothetical protein n=1 Tax=Acinetobacter soli TaxID=487316 RepID=UPI00125F337B|nr:hypothetical protein [Acinetobacter soli]